jgi:hypothetical protein
MNFIDRTFRINPEDAVESNPAYATYRLGLKWSAIGSLAIAGGLVVEKLTGAETGISVALGACPVEMVGGVALAAGLTDLEPK